MATTQLNQVLEIVELHTWMEGGTVARAWSSSACNGDLDSSVIYKALKTANSCPDAWAKFVWQNKAPPRVKFFFA
jgi:hypothetical protein